MNKLLPLFFSASLACAQLSCVSFDKDSDDDGNDVTSRFNNTWNVYEELHSNADGSITYNALPWGGLVGTFLNKNLPMDLSGYESITFDFQEPTPVATQVVVGDRFKTWGKKGITSLTCHFDGQNVSMVSEIVLQAGDTCTLNVKDVYLTPCDGMWEPKTIWKGNCSFGNWENGFSVLPDKFSSAYAGDKLELFLTAEKSRPELTYWLIKSIYSGTDSTLQGNDSELNTWGCASVSKDMTVYRIVLTEDDVWYLRENGLFVNGYYTNVTQCNLLSKVYDDAEGQEE